MEFLGEKLSLFWALPFVGLVLSISLLPVILTKFWHKHEGKICLFWVFLTLSMLAYLGGGKIVVSSLFKTFLHHYIPFMSLILALYIIGSGIKIRLLGKTSPFKNVCILAAGIGLSNIVGTTGASMILIRPLLTLNKNREFKTHIVIFFIFIVANIGGCLTPIGDPPLFLGYLEGIPFFWSVQNLFLPLVFISLCILGIFYVLDSFYYKKQLVHIEEDKDHSYELEGKRNFGLLLLVICILIAYGFVKNPVFLSMGSLKINLFALLRDLSLIILSIFSWKVTPKKIHTYNQFNFHPLLEVAKVFAAIFVTLIPVSAMLDAGMQGAFSPLLGVLNAEGRPDSFLYFWITGILSAFLDNAPTYLVFFHLAGADPILLTTKYATTLVAISSGAVFMGALTYIGNAPNFMVRAIAAKSGVKMPSFFGYMGWSCAILVPVYLIFSMIFFWGY